MEVFCLRFIVLLCYEGARERLQIQLHKKANFSNSKYFEFYSFSAGLFWSARLSHPMFRKQLEPQNSG